MTAIGASSSFANLRTRLRSLNSCRSLFETIDLKKVCDDCQELFGFLDIHEMTNIGNHDSARVGNGGLDGSRVRVDVRDVGIADQDERWHMNLVQTRQRRRNRSGHVIVREVLGCHRQEIANFLACCGMIGGGEIFVVCDSCDGRSSVALIDRSPGSRSPNQEVIGKGDIR
jgi:hypothetical protein